MKTIRLYLFLVLSAPAFLLLPSCVQDDPAAGEESAASFQLRSVINPGLPDDRISGLRVMAFANGSNTIRSNVYYPSANLAQQIVHHMAAGNYNFVFIANEPSSMRTTLDNVLNLGALASISIPANEINDGADIPMVLRVDDVTVLPGTAGVRIGGSVHKPWDIVLPRLAIRMDILLWSDNGADSDFNGAVFSNLPDAVPILGAYTGTHTVTRTYPKSAFTAVTKPGAVWAYQLTRAILPANLFTPAGQASRVIRFNVQLTGNGPMPGCTFGIDETGGDYTMPGNKYLQVTAEVKYPMEVNIEASPWDDIAVDGTMYEQRTLKISQLQATVSELSMARVYFDSNQPGVYVEPTGYTDATGSTTFNVNDIFPGLAGPGAANVHYTTGTSAGYMDISQPRIYYVPTRTYRIYINANGLRRELTVNTIERQPSELYDFIGTFHRWNQTGERLIYDKFIETAWTATVEYPAGQEPFVVLSLSKSLDPNAGTDSPGDAENFQVTDGASSISGPATPGMIFRVGLTSKLPSASSPPRYARIRLTAGSTTKVYYVRQGEAADYVMRPQDTGGSGESWGTPNRPKAARFSPYNLTDPGKTYDRVDRGTRGYSFTQFPTQSGYLFPWNGTTAYYPQTVITPAPAVTPFSLWDDSPQWETCPPGYRRPDDGSTSAYVDLTPSAALVANSTVRQSLWLNPPLNTGFDQDSPGNYTMGYYADGFFDRHLIYNRDMPPQTISIAGRGADVAYRGQLFYNPATFASLFFPNASMVNGDGSLSYQVTYRYWTSSASSVDSAIATSVYVSGPYMMSTNYMNAPNSYGTAFGIRCVVDE